MSRSVRPRGVVLNAVRVAPERAVEVKRLVEIGGLFGLKPNAMRVAITRLVADGMLESDERGQYRMGAAAATLGAHVEQWRRGETRVRDWQGGWLAAVLGPASDRRLRRQSLKALGRLGFREALPGMWLRPDNLAEGLDHTRHRLAQLGLEDGAETFVGRDFGPRMARRLRKDLWPVSTLLQAQRKALKRLERSLPKLSAMPRDAALVESFLYGGEAIRVLATDPLLPNAIMPSETRTALTERMLAYDAVGHRLWRAAAEPPVLRLMGGDRAG